MLSSVAYFDCLALTTRLQRRLPDPSIAEIHLFAYLSCLLWLYEGNPLSNWGYDFVVTRNSFPFSRELRVALLFLTGTGYVETINQQQIHVSNSGIDEYTMIKELSLFSQREKYLDGACSSLLSLPVGIIRRAICKEPNIEAAVSLEQSRRLLTETDTDFFYEHFRALSSTLGIESNDLIVPAVVWLEYLQRTDFFKNSKD